MRLGEVVVTCPACGASLPVQVRLGSVRVYHESVVAAFHDGSADHKCEGRS